MARLTLDGPNGKLCVHATYLDPSSVGEQVLAMKDISQSIVDDAHNVIAGDFNFVENTMDRTSKASANASRQDDR